MLGSRKVPVAVTVAKADLLAQAYGPDLPFLTAGDPAAETLDDLFQRVRRSSRQVREFLEQCGAHNLLNAAQEYAARCASERNGHRPVGVTYHAVSAIGSQPDEDDLRLARKANPWNCTDPLAAVIGQILDLRRRRRPPPCRERTDPAAPLHVGDAWRGRRQPLPDRRAVGWVASRVVQPASAGAAPSLPVRPPREPGDRPVAFGWLDHAGLRVAFWRIGLDPLRGKQGNFSAHLLVGHPEAMPEGELARRFDSPFWWRGGGLADPSIVRDPASLVLPAVWLGEIAEGEDGAVPAAADRLAGELLELRRGERLAVATDSWELGRCLRAIALTIPEALDGITVSTYETRPAVPFRLLGTRAVPSTYRAIPNAAVDPGEISILSRLRRSPRAAAALRFAERPLDALQTLDRAQSVFYVGTFSKSLLPDFRLGYLVAPPWAVAALTAAKQVSAGQGHAMEQAAVALLIREGHLARHVRRMQRVYGARRDLILGALRAEFAGRLEALPSVAGLHLATRLEASANEGEVIARARHEGVRLAALSRYYAGRPSLHGLLFGYGNIDEKSAHEGMIRLRRAMGAQKIHGHRNWIR